MRPLCLVLFLPVYSLFKCFRRSHAYHMCSVLFLPVQVCSRVSEALLLALRTWSLSFLTDNSSSDNKAFPSFIVFSDSPTAVHRAFLSFNAKAWPQSQTDLFTCTTVLHCGHTFLRCRDLFHSIACTMVLCNTVGIPF